MDAKTAKLYYKIFMEKCDFFFYTTRIIQKSRWNSVGSVANWSCGYGKHNSLKSDESKLDPNFYGFKIKGNYSDIIVLWSMIVLCWEGIHDDGDLLHMRCVE